MSLSEAKLVAFLIAALAVFAAGFMLSHRLDAARYASLELSYAQAKAKAVDQAQAEQRRLDDIALGAAQQEASAQAGMRAATARQLQEVRRHVANDARCVTFGALRVLDAAALGVDADDLALPAGKSDGSCAPADAVAVAQSIAGNYSVARQNAEQLDALIGFLRKAQAEHRGITAK